MKKKLKEKYREGTKRHENEERTAGKKVRRKKKKLQNQVGVFKIRCTYIRDHISCTQATYQLLLQFTTPTLHTELNTNNPFMESFWVPSAI